MPDAAHYWGNDLAVSPSGDIALVDGDTLTTQRILRRLLTVAGTYIFRVDYGAGLPKRIGELLDVDALRGAIFFQIKKEETVARVPAPIITITPITGGAAIRIVYASAITGQQRTLSFDVNK